MVSEPNFDPRSSYLCLFQVFVLFLSNSLLPSKLFDQVAEKKKKKNLHPKSLPLLASFPSTKPPPQSTLSSSELALILLDRRCNISSTPALPFSLTSFHHRGEKTKHASSPLPAFYSQTVLHSIKVGIFFIVTPQNPRVPLTTNQPAEFLLISGNPIPYYCVPFIGIHIFTKIRQSILSSRSSIQHITCITV